MLLKDYALDIDNERDVRAQVFGTGAYINGNVLIERSWPPHTVVARWGSE